MVESFSQIHNNIAIVRYKHTVVVNVNDGLAHLATFPTRPKAVTFVNVVNHGSAAMIYLKNLSKCLLKKHSKVEITLESRDELPPEVT